MASTDCDKSKFTYQQVTAWRKQLFDNRSLRITVEELGHWPLGPYLWAAVLQAAHLDDLRVKTKTSGNTSVGLWALRQGTSAPVPPGRKPRSD